MMGSGLATAALVVVGLILVVIGILAGGSLPMIALGVLSLVAGGILQVWGSKRA